MKAIYFLPLFFVIQLSAQNNPDLRTGYTFEGNANDVIGANHLTIHGDVISTSDRFGNENCAYYFPGITPPGSTESQGDTSAYLYLDNPDEDLNVNYSDGWSLSLWYKGGSSGVGDLEHIFTRTNDPLDQFDITCYEVNLYDLNTPLISVFKDFPPSESNNYIWAEQSEANLDSTVWHHVVLVVSQNTNISLYVDNTFQDSISDPSLFDVCTSKLFIGYDFEGKIDDIYYYQSPLSLTQIDSLFNAESSCTTALSITDKVKSNNYNLYPNPSSDNITLEIDNEAIGSYIEIYDLRGKLIYQSKLFSNSNTINVESFPRGFYTLQINPLDQKYPERIKFVLE